MESYDFDFLSRRQFRLTLKNQQKVQKYYDILQTTQNTKHVLALNSISIDSRETGGHDIPNFDIANFLRFDPKIIEKFCEIVEHLTTIISISVCLRDFEQDEFLSILEAIKKSKSITSLSLIGHQFDSISLRAFATFLGSRDCKLGSFSWSLNKVSQEPMMHVILESLKTNSSIRSLELNSSVLIRSFFESLASLLEENEKLEELVAQYCVLVPVDAIAELSPSLKRNKTLRLLSICYSEIGSDCACLGSLIDSNCSIQDLRLNYAKLGGDSLISLANGLKKNSSVRSLRLSGNAAIPSPVFEHFAKALEENETLEELYLSNCQIGDESAKLLAQSLTKNYSLTMLDLGSCSIGYQGFLAIGELLKESDSLQKICLYNNQIPSMVAGGKSNSFFEGIASSRALSSLDLSLISLDEITIQTIFHAINLNSSLRKLDLTNCDLESEVFSHISDSLASNSSLKTLLLAGNTIPLNFATSFEKYQYLTELDLSFCQIESEAIRHICDALKTNESLRKISFSESNFEDRELSFIADMLRENHTLRVLTIYSNVFSYTAVSKLAKAIENNETIQHIYVQKYHALLSPVLSRNRKKKRKLRDGYLDILLMLYYMDY